MALVTQKDKHGKLLTTEQMIKRFARQVERDQILNDLRKHEFFVPKGIKRAQKSAKHQRMLKKLANKK